MSAIRWWERTAKRTMLYMAVSLSITAGGLLLCYLLANVRRLEGQTLNAVLGDWIEDPRGRSNAAVASEAWAVVGRLWGHLAHDLNNHLASVLGNAELGAGSKIAAAAQPCPIPHHAGMQCPAVPGPKPCRRAQRAPAAHWASLLQTGAQECAETP